MEGYAWRTTPRIVCTCADCGCGFQEGFEAYKIENEIYCEDCAYQFVRNSKFEVREDRCDERW